MIWQVVLGMLLGAAVITIAYSVCCFVTNSNLGKTIREAIENSKNETLKKLIGKGVKISVTNSGINEISITVLEADVEEAKNAEITIQSSAGIDESVCSQGKYVDFC